MNAVCDDVYAVDLSLHGFRQGQYLPIVRRAMEQLQWQVVAVQEDKVACLTTDNDHWGAIITVTADDTKARLEYRPANEYYTDRSQADKNVTLLQQAITTIVHEVHVADRNLHPMHREKYGALLPSKSYKATPLLVYANTLVFLAMVLAGVGFLEPRAQDLYTWGGNLRPAVASGDWWRLFTYMFLHGGAVHLIMNTFALLYIGMFLEPLMGKLRFTAAYLLTGVCAGLLSIAMHPASVGVGASGAIFGMYGVFLSLLTTKYIKKTLRKTMLRSILFFVTLNLLYGLQGNTDNAAHIGGLLSGAAIGFVYTRGILKQHTIRQQWVTTAVLSTVVMAAVGIATIYIRSQY